MRELRAVQDPDLSQPITEMLASFVSHFTRAIRQEMDSMRERRGLFEIALADGERIESAGEAGGELYRYKVASNDEKLVAGVECTLRTLGGAHLIRVEHIDHVAVTVRSDRPVDVGDGQATLVIYPWFLYERLLSVLGEIDPDRFSVERAMALFGKLPAKSQHRELRREHAALNRSQQAAVQLCCDRDLAFVWGPPGTGKTTTLAHIVSELLAQSMRVLVLSTTNAALDQALEKAAADPDIGTAIAAGKVVRIGRSDGPTFGAALRDVVSRLTTAHQKSLDRLLKRRPVVDTAVRSCEKALESLSAADAAFQESLFGDERPRSLVPNVANIFGVARSIHLQSLGPKQLRGVIQRRYARFLRVQELCVKRIEERRNALARKEREVIDGALLVLSTLTNAYFSPFMQEQRFDVVIVEEASMAVLPALFYAACLGRRKTVMVGDPCQLPSIVQSEKEYVRKVMGRNIFDVTVTDPLSSPLVAMLDVQYRMHPVIGQLVSDLFYSGRLQHGGEMTAREFLASVEPFRGAPLIVLDTAGHTVCRQGAGGQSRVNLQTAEVCVDLALLAVHSGAGSTAVITPYVDQARAIKTLLKKRGDEARGIECSTVHRFQGQERDVVILDTVDADPLRPGVLLSERDSGSSARNLMNVALSRARGKLVIVADVNYFRSRAPAGVMANIIDRALAVGHREILRHAPKQI